ncbi:MAG: ribokinase [Ilumatobacteraceae bacterium]
MDAIFDVCVVGSANLDLVASTERLPGPGETVLGTSFAEHAGGKGLNQAVAATRAGARVAFVGAVGRDAAGDALLGVMDDEGIDIGGVDRVAAPTGRALIGVNADGENSIIVVPGANALVDATRVRDRLPIARVVLVQLEVPTDVVAATLVAARANDSTTVLNPAPAAALPADLLANCDLVIPNEHEAELLGGTSGLLAAGAAGVVVTRGGAGITVHGAKAGVDMAAFTVDPVDTTAAGDAFCGALCARLAAGDPLATALRFAMAAGALATTRAGAVPSLPHLDEIEELVRRAG